MADQVPRAATESAHRKRTIPERDMWRLLRRCLVPAVLWLACLLCSLQLLAGFANDRQEELADPTHRLRPRHVGGEPEVRGRTYQRHGAEPLDARHRALHRERMRLNGLVRPHLVARRQIFSASSPQPGTSDFLGRDHEDAWPNVSCATCALVGYSGHLLGSGLGSSVDASDCVIRLGLSPGEGYRSDVGSKTTFRLLHADAYQLSGAEPSTVWYAIRLTETIGCQSLGVYGVPEPKICKLHRNEPSRSLFWEYSSRPQCVEGLDAGHNEDPLRPDYGQLSLLDRRALAGWLHSKPSSYVQFRAPAWSASPRVSTAAAAT